PAVVERGLPHLGKMRTLRRLRITSGRIPPGDLAALVPLRLESLHLAYRTADGGMEHVGRMTSLRVLYCPPGVVGDDQAVHVGRLPSLRKLFVWGGPLTSSKEDRGTPWANRLTDGGLAHLRHLAHLEELDLTGTDVTDRGLEMLACLPRLR